MFPDRFRFFTVLRRLQVMTVTFQEKVPVYAKRSDPVPPARPQPPTPSAYSTPYPQAASTNNTPYPTGPGAMPMPQPYASPSPNQPPPYPSAASPYQAPYQPYGVPPPPVHANIDRSQPSRNSSTQSLTQSVNSNTAGGYNTIQPSHIRASLTSAIDDRLRQRLKEVMGAFPSRLLSSHSSVQALLTPSCSRST